MHLAFCYLFREQERRGTREKVLVRLHQKQQRRCSGNTSASFSCLAKQSVQFASEGLFLCRQPIHKQGIPAWTTTRVAGGCRTEGGPLQVSHVFYHIFSLSNVFTPKKSILLHRILISNEIEDPLFARLMPSDSRAASRPRCARPTSWELL